MKTKKTRVFLTKIMAILLLVFSLTGNFAVEAAGTTITNAAQVDQLVEEGYNKGVKGPVSIIKGTLKTTFSSKEVYLVTLSGTELVFNQSTEVLTDLFSGFNLNNAYYYNVVNIIQDNIPKGANIMLAGHSLGGMVAQQIAGNSTIKSRYNILNTVTFGSPLLSAGTREGTIKRLGDINDPVPFLSVSTFTLTLWQLLGLNRENGGYYLRPISAHTDCYEREDVWGKYDVTGTKYGNAKLVLEMETRKWFKSPIIGNYAY